MTSTTMSETSRMVREKVKAKRNWLWWAGGGLLLVAALATYFMTRGNGEARPALTAKVHKGDLELEVVETGRIEPLERVELKSKVAGQVAEVLVEEGAAVKKDQVLLRLDPTDFQREVARARAEVELARSSMSYADSMLERRQRALGDRGASQAEVDLASSDAQGKRAQLRLAQVQLQAAEDKLRYTEIRSPMDGTVLERGVEPGEVVTPGVQATFEGKPLLTLGNLSSLIAKTELNQIDVAKVSVGQKVTLSLDALPGQSFDAVITQVAPASVKPKGKEVDVFPVEAKLEKANPALKPGMTADVRISIDSKPAVLTAPIEAVVKDGSKSFVKKLVETGGKIHHEKVEVKTGVRNDRDVELVDGVKEGDELIIDPGASTENEAKL